MIKAAGVSVPSVTDSREPILRAFICASPRTLAVILVADLARPRAAVARSLGVHRLAGVSPSSRARLTPSPIARPAARLSPRALAVAGVASSSTLASLARSGFCDLHWSNRYRPSTIFLASSLAPQWLSLPSGASVSRHRAADFTGRATRVLAIFAASLLNWGALRGLSPRLTTTRRLAPSPAGW